jgi:hypothetical protein
VRTLLATVLLLVGPLTLAGCDVLPPPRVIVGEDVRCGAFEGPDCNDLLEIGLDAIAAGGTDPPLAIAVDDACPPNARCAASALGGVTAAVIVRWPDGTMDWAQIPLAPDWPATAPGPAVRMTDPPPAHLLELVGA